MKQELKLGDMATSRERVITVPKSMQQVSPEDQQPTLGPGGILETAVHSDSSGDGVQGSESSVEIKYRATTPYIYYIKVHTFFAVSQRNWFSNCELI